MRRLQQRLELAGIAALGKEAVGIVTSGQFDAPLNLECVLTKTTPVKSILLIRVIERPLLDATDATRPIRSN